MVSFTKFLAIAAFAAPAFAQTGCQAEILSEAPDFEVIASACVPPGGVTKIWSARRQANFYVEAKTSCGLGFQDGGRSDATFRLVGRGSC